MAPISTAGQIPSFTANPVTPSLGPERGLLNRMVRYRDIRSTFNIVLVSKVKEIKFESTRTRNSFTKNFLAEGAENRAIKNSIAVS